MECVRGRGLFSAILYSAEQQGSAVHCDVVGWRIPGELSLFVLSCISRVGQLPTRAFWRIRVTLKVLERYLDGTHTEPPRNLHGAFPYLQSNPEPSRKLHVLGPYPDLRLFKILGRVRWNPLRADLWRTTARVAVFAANELDGDLQLGIPALCEVMDSGVYHWSTTGLTLACSSFPTGAL